MEVAGNYLYLAVSVTDQASGGLRVIESHPSSPFLAASINLPDVGSAPYLGAGGSTSPMDMPTSLRHRLYGYSTYPTRRILHRRPLTRYPLLFCHRTEEMWSCKDHMPTWYASGNIGKTTQHRSPEAWLFTRSNKRRAGLQGLL